MEGILIEMGSLAPVGVFFAGLIFLALVAQRSCSATRPRRRSGASGCTGQSGRSPGRKGQRKRHSPSGSISRPPDALRPPRPRELADMACSRVDVHSVRKKAQPEERTMSQMIRILVREGIQERGGKGEEVTPPGCDLPPSIGLRCINAFQETERTANPAQSTALLGLKKGGVVGKPVGIRFLPSAPVCY